MRPRLQFRLKWLLILIAVLSAPLSWLGWKLEEKRRERWAVAEIRRMASVVLDNYDLRTRFEDEPPGPVCLRRLLGDDFFVHVEIVMLKPGSAPADDALIYLQYCAQLRDLDLTGCKVTDSALVQLRQLCALEYLDVTDTKLSADGIAALQQALPNCKIQRRSN